MPLTGALWSLPLDCHPWSHLDFVDNQLHMSTDYPALQSCRANAYLWCQVTITEHAASVARWHLDAYEDIVCWTQRYIMEMRLTKAVLATTRKSYWIFRTHVGVLQGLVSLTWAFQASAGIHDGDRQKSHGLWSQCTREEQGRLKAMLTEQPSDNLFPYSSQRKYPFS